MNEKRIFFGGNIITMDVKQPIVESIGINGKLIEAVGDLEYVKKKLGKNYKLVDLEGNTMLPGFIDCHLHPILSIFFLIVPDLSNITNLNDLERRLKELTSEKNPNELILALKLPDMFFDNNLITRSKLDQFCPTNPIILLRREGHSGMANTKALQLVDINPESDIVVEEDLDLLLSKVKIPNPDDFGDIVSKFSLYLAKKGITSIHAFTELDGEGGASQLQGVEIPILKNVSNEILQNVYNFTFTKNPKKLKRLQKAPLDDGDKYGKFKIGGLKQYLDGTLSSSTAYMFEPFSGEDTNKGIFHTNPEILYERMVKAHNLGFQLAIHAIGDKANRILVDLYKKLLTEYPRENHRHRIEHGFLLKDDVIKDMKNLGLVVSLQPILGSWASMMEERIGIKRCKYSYRLKSIMLSGVPLAAGSDCPMDDPDPFVGIQDSVLRDGFVPEEAISVYDALKTYTINGAYAAFEEDVKGSIEEEKLADIIILDKNPLDVPKDQIKDIQVLETIIRGKTVYTHELSRSIDLKFG